MCGSWKQNTAIPADLLSIETLDLLDANVYINIQDILTDTSNEGTEALKKTKDLYKMCMDVDALDKEGIKPIWDYLKKIKGWPLLQQRRRLNCLHSSWQNIHQKVPDIFGDYVLFDIQSAANRHPDAPGMIHIFQPQTVLSSGISFEKQEDLDLINNYKEQIRNVALHFINQKGLSVMEDMEQEINDLVDFELRLAQIKIPLVENADIDQLLNDMPIEGFQMEYNSFGGNHPKAKINWLETIKYVFEPLGIKIKKTDVINPIHMDYLSKLPSVLRKTEPRTVVNYIIWHLIRRMMKYSDTRLTHIIHEFYAKTNLDEMPTIRRKTTCLGHTNLRKAISLEYLNRHFSTNTKTKAEELIDHLIKVAEETIGKISWLDEAGKKNTMEKVSAIKRFVGYPESYTAEAIDDYYKNFKLGSTYLQSMINLYRFQKQKDLSKLQRRSELSSWEDEPTEVGATYSTLTNDITVTAGFLQFPVLVEDVPSVLNYAALGSIVTHEISHSFDMRGCRIDKYGNLVDLWSPEMREIFYEKTKCFVDQFSKFVIQELSVEGRNVKINGKITLSENIADSTGLQIAYNAFKDYLKRTSGTKEVRLKRLESYSPQKLFFMHYAYIFCSNTRPGKAAYCLDPDCHATPEARVRGSIQNHEDFHQVFSCKPDTPMNPSKKCSVLR
ncbi:membrane metallo-endopeptidase-like 1 isoform X2 [Prorops nasuta]